MLMKAAHPLVAITCPGVELNDRIGSCPVAVSASSYAGIETLADQRLPGLIAPRQQAKRRDVIIQEEYNGLRAHTALGVESHVDRYAVGFAGLRRDVLRCRAKLRI